MFGFATCFISANMLIAVGKMTPDCDLYSGSLDDVQPHDDGVLHNNCIGKSSAVFFDSIAVTFTLIAATISLIYNFPLEGTQRIPVTSVHNEEKINSFGTDDPGSQHRHSSVSRDRLLSEAKPVSRETPVASTLFRFQSYYYTGESEKNNNHDNLMDASSGSSINRPLLL
jgi:hypothetical protein